MRLAESADLHGLVTEKVHVPTDKGSNAAGKVATIVAGMAGSVLWPCRAYRYAVNLARLTGDRHRRGAGSDPGVPGTGPTGLAKPPTSTPTTASCATRL